MDLLRSPICVAVSPSSDDVIDATGAPAKAAAFTAVLAGITPEPAPQPSAVALVASAGDPAAPGDRAPDWSAPVETMTAPPEADVTADARAAPAAPLDRSPPPVPQTIGTATTFPPSVAIAPRTSERARPTSGAGDLSTGEPIATGAALPPPRRPGVIVPMAAPAAAQSVGGSNGLQAPWPDQPDEDADRDDATADAAAQAVTAPATMPQPPAGLTPVAPSDGIVDIPVATTPPLRDQIADAARPMPAGSRPGSDQHSPSGKAAGPHRAGRSMAAAEAVAAFPVAGMQSVPAAVRQPIATPIADDAGTADHADRAPPFSSAAAAPALVVGDPTETAPLPGVGAAATVIESLGSPPATSLPIVRSAAIVAGDADHVAAAPVLSALIAVAHQRSDAGARGSPPIPNVPSATIEMLAGRRGFGPAAQSMPVASVQSAANSTPAALDAVPVAIRRAAVLLRIGVPRTGDVGARVLRVDDTVLVAMTGEMATVATREPAVPTVPAAAATSAGTAPASPTPTPTIAAPSRAPRARAVDRPASDETASAPLLAAAAPAAATPDPAPTASGTLAASGADRHAELARHAAWADFTVAPAALGAVSVEVSRSGEGASVRLVASSEGAREALDAARPQLVAEARAQGLHIRDAQVDLASSAGDGTGSGPHRDAGPHQPAAASAEPPRPATVVETTSLTTGAYGGAGGGEAGRQAQQQHARHQPSSPQTDRAAAARQASDPGRVTDEARRTTDGRYA